MDPLAMLRGDIESMRYSPLERAFLMGQAEDAREARQAEIRRAEARDRAEANLIQQQAVERAEIARQGYSTRELEEHKREREAQRAERAAELWDELQRVDPQLAAQKRAEVARTSQAAEMEATLRRARAVGEDPYMRQEIRRFHERGAARERAERQADIARLEHELGYVSR